MHPNDSEKADLKSAIPPSSTFPEGQWSTGLYDCWDDRSTCLKTFFCPCVIVGQIVEIIDKGATTQRNACGIYYALMVLHCTWLYTRKYRSKLRALFKLPEAPCSDVLVSCCCCACAICQEYRELKNRGVDPSIGWKANVEKWKQEGVTLPPLPPSGMAR